jgi:hypothetical protein
MGTELDSADWIQRAQDMDMIMKSQGPHNEDNSLTT